MMREIDTEQQVVWPEWCYNTTGKEDYILINRP